MGDHRGAAPHRAAHRGDARADPPQLHRLHPAHHRRGGAAAAGQPVQDRPRAAAARQPGTGRSAEPRSSPGSAASNEQLPLVSRYDGAERLHSPAPAVPVPAHLADHVSIAFTHLFVKELLDRLVEISPDPGRGRHRPLRFTPHDFRRIFATDAGSGRAARAHPRQDSSATKRIATTQTYVAVYDHDVIEHHRAFIARRRTLRPSAGIPRTHRRRMGRVPQTLRETQGRTRHLRSRATDTRCQHEHACLRCARPSARPDATAPARGRSSPICTTDLPEAARTLGWLGEVDGLEASIAAGQQKLAAMTRRPARGDGPVSIGMPALPCATRMGEQLATDVAALSVPDVTLATTDQ